MSLTLEKLNPHAYPLSEVAKKNQATLLTKLLMVEHEYGQQFIVTSGVRSWADHVAIYEKINQRRADVGYPPLHVPDHSNHLAEIAAAVDISDPSKSLWNFLMNNLQMVKDLGLYLEMRQGAWVHFQDVAPHSGHTIFQP